jgi:hypothetical protein
MTTAQDSPRRKKQKIRRAKRLVAWRAAKAAASAVKSSASTKGAAK